MSRMSLGVWSFLLATFVAVSPAAAQYGRYSMPDPATGERYHVEGRFGFWNPSPNIIVSSESLNIVGSKIDAVQDLGFTSRKFSDMHLVLRPATKHKFLFDYLPISYSVESVLKRDITFNGQKYQVGLPVNSLLEWKSYRFGYEYDFLYRDRWFVGVIVDAKYTDAQVSLASPIDTEYARAKAPIPALGGIFRVYPAANISVTTEITGMKLPESIDKRYKGHYMDVNVYGTINFTDHAGAQIGYRSLDVGYTVRQDYGAFQLKGLYFAGVARF